MANVTEIKPVEKQDHLDTIKGCKAYAAGDLTSLEWCRRNRGQWCKKAGKWCEWRRI